MGFLGPPQMYCSLHCIYDTYSTHYDLVIHSELPSQVLGFAAFFALVLKKVDQEEYGEPQLEDNLRNPGSYFTVFIVLCIVLCGIKNI